MDPPGGLGPYDTLPQGLWAPPRVSSDPEKGSEKEPEERPLWVQGLGLGLGFRVQGLGFRGLGVWKSGA